MRKSSPSSTSYTWARSVGKKPGLLHRALAHEHRRHDRHEPLARRARRITHCTSASSSSTASRMTYANREPLASAPRAVSTKPIASANAAWSSGGRVGRVADDARPPRRRPRRRRAPTRRPGSGPAARASRNSRLDRLRDRLPRAASSSFSAPAAAIFAGRSSGAALPISFDAAFCARAQLLDLGERARVASSAASTSSIRPARTRLRSMPRAVLRLVAQPLEVDHASPVPRICARSCVDPVGRVLPRLARARAGARRRLPPARRPGTSRGTSPRPASPRGCAGSRRRARRRRGPRSR